MSEKKVKRTPAWASHFLIQPAVELDFVVGQQGWPVGVQRRSPPEFKRRIVAAAISHMAGLSSIDYTKKRYVDLDLYENQTEFLGDEVSDYLSNITEKLIAELFKLHTPGELPFGVLGAELTLDRVPYAIDTARKLANRGLLLEVLPILRLCLEMAAWAKVAFHIKAEKDVIALAAQSCISKLKDIYGNTGKIYGYLSKFTHWGFLIHGQFIDLEGENTAVLYASPRYRAMALALCLVVVDVLVEVVRFLYGQRSDSLILAVQTCIAHNSEREIFKMLAAISNKTGLPELREIRSLLA